jgi:hypothetical protein
MTKRTRAKEAGDIPPHRRDCTGALRKPTQPQGVGAPPIEIETIPVGTWTKLHELLQSDRLRNWAFRGQEDAIWPLQSSLTRDLARKGIHPGAWQEQEGRIIRIFRRKAHLLLDRAPADFFEWLALMQHHGAPTRLLDFTWSPYVAAFFALDRATKPAAIWAICSRKLRDHGEEIIYKARARVPANRVLPPLVCPWNEDGLASVVLSNRHRAVFMGEPYHMNRRLIAQSGTFVVPGVIDCSVDQLIARQPGGRSAILKIELDTQKLRDEAVRALYTMNLTHATLFPDLDGLARSMSWELEMSWRKDPRTLRPLVD